MADAPEVQARVTKPVRDLAFASLIVSVFLASLAQLDPFGLKTAADLQSEAVFMRMIGGPWYESSARSRVTVILINDEYLEAVGESWPMSYLQQDLLLTDVLGYEPKAVFLDFLYRHRHGSETEIAQLAQTVHESLPDMTGERIPVFLPFLVRDIDGNNTCEGNGAGGAPLQPADIVLNDSVLKVMQPPREQRTYIGWSGCGNRYPMYLAGNDHLPTPAFAMYRTYCMLGESSSSDCKAIIDSDYSDFSSPMVINWGTGVSDLHHSAMSEGSVDCTRTAEINRAGYAADQLWNAFTQAFSSLRERGHAERCTHTDTLHATWLLGTSGEVRDLLTSMIKDRYVFIGTHVDGVSDYILSPVNGQLPGVYLFAMALDNLITMNDSYITELNLFWSWALEAGTLFLITFCAIVIWNFIGISEQRRSWWITALTLVGYKFLLPLTISLGVAAVMWTVFHTAPMDWVTVSLLGFLANPIKLSDCSRIPGINYICKTLSTESS